MLGQRPSGRELGCRWPCATCCKRPPGHPARGRQQAHGRSPGSRVIALVRSSRDRDDPSDFDWTKARRLQLRGQRRPRQRGSPASLLTLGFAIRETVTAGLAVKCDWMSMRCRLETCEVHCTDMSPTGPVASEADYPSRRAAVIAVQIRPLLPILPGKPIEIVRPQSARPRCVGCHRRGMRIINMTRDPLYWALVLGIGVFRGLAAGFKSNKENFPQDGPSWLLVPLHVLMGSVGAVLGAVFVAPALQMSWQLFAGSSTEIAWPQPVSLQARFLVVGTGIGAAAGVMTLFLSRRRTSGG